MTDEASYGQRFLTEWRRLSGALGDFTYAELQDMKKADCEGLVRALRKQNAFLPYATVQLLRESEPEQAARTMFAQAQLTSQTNLLVFVAGIL